MGSRCEVNAVAVQQFFHKMPALGQRLQALATHLPAMLEGCEGGSQKNDLHVVPSKAAKTGWPAQVDSVGTLTLLNSSSSCTE